MTKLLTLLAATGLVASTSAAVVSCGQKKESNESTKEVSLKEGAMKADIKLFNSAMVKEGKMTFAGDEKLVKITDEKLESGKYSAKVKAESLPEQAKTLTLTFTYTAPKHKAAKEEAKPIEFKVTVKLEAAKKSELSTLIKVKELGEISDNKEETIKKQIDEKNPSATGNYSLSEITETSAIAKGTGNYQGTVKVTFTIKKQSETF